MATLMYYSKCVYYVQQMFSGMDRLKSKGIVPMKYPVGFNGGLLLTWKAYINNSWELFRCL